jgi:hypothetical protein
MEKSKLYMDIGSWTGIGNQMFQYAAIQSLALKNDFQVVIKKSFNYLLDKFTFIRENQIYTDNIECNNTWSEKKDHVYDETFFKINNEKDLMISGHFENIKYVNREHIVNIFKFDDDIINNHKKFLESCKINHKTKLIAMHMRLSNDPDPNTHTSTMLYTIPTQSYVNEAMPCFDLDNDVFIICSNDVERCKRTYEFSSKNIIWFCGDELNDICIMSLCDEYILTPSTFGWWACFLNTNTSKKIIMMKPWFNIYAHGKHLNKDFNLFFENAKIYDIHKECFE